MTEVGRELDRRTARRRIAPTGPRDGARPSAGRLYDRIPRGWSVGTVLAWAAGIVLILLLEPAAADPEAASALAHVLGTAVAVGLSVTVLGLAMRYRFGLAAGAVTGGLMLLGSVACPVTGHHAFGAWWLGELAVVAGLTGLAFVGHRRASATE